MALIVKPGATSVSVTIRIVDAVDGTPETGVNSSTPGLKLYYRREGAVVSEMTPLGDLGGLASGWDDDKLIHIGRGYYRVDVRDAAFAINSPGVLIFGEANDMVVIGEYVQLTQSAAAIFDGAQRGGTFNIPASIASVPNTPTPEEVMSYLYLPARRRVRSNRATGYLEFYDENATTVIMKRQLAENATNFDQGAVEDGP